MRERSRYRYETPEMVLLEFETEDIFMTSSLTGNDNFTVNPGEDDTIVDGSDGWD